MANYQKKILTIQQQVQAFIDAGMAVKFEFYMSDDDTESCEKK